MKASQIQKGNKKLAAGLLIFSLLLAACGSSTGASSSASATDSGGGGTGGTGTDQKITLSNIHSQPKQLGVGDLLYVDLNSSTSLDFDGVDAGAEFSLAMINSSASQGNLTVAMQGDLSDVNLDLAKEVDAYEEEASPSLPNDITENFHAFLREQEKETEYWGAPVDGASASAGKSAGGAAAAEAVSLGHQRIFKVLSSLSNTRDYVEVTATAECVGSNVIFYIDADVTQTMLSDADVQSLCNTFDPVVARELSLFGNLSDVDGNGKVIALFTPRVNRLGGLGGGIITGFFLSNDLYASSGSNPASNYGEMLYIMVPDPSGQYGATVSREFAMSNLLPSVLPHELQHAISYNEHVFVSGGASENSCLNEGMSHLAEDLMGQGQENPSRYGIYLRSPQSYSVIACSQASLGSRGGSYLFLRYLYEQAANGDAFLARLIRTSQTGIQNIETAFAGSSADFDQFPEFFMRWSVAITGITQDSRFSFKSRERDSATGQWRGACVSCAADDGRGTTLSGVSSTAYRGSQNNSLRTASVRFFKIAGVQSKIDFNYSSGQGYGVLIRKK